MKQSGNTSIKSNNLQALSLKNSDLVTIEGQSYMNIKLSNGHHTLTLYLYPQKLNSDLKIEVVDLKH